MTTRAAATLIVGAGLGAGLMYYFDPDRGSRRRTHARNQMRHASHQLRDTARAQWESRRREPDDDDDRIVAERVRAVLDRVVSHVHALVLEVSKGVVTVSGPIVRDEVRLTLKALNRVPGVRRVVSALEPRPAPRRLRDQGTGARRIAAALVGAASLGLAARAAMNARSHEFELRS